MSGNDGGVWFYSLTLLSLGVTVAGVLLGRRLHRLTLALLVAISVWTVAWVVGYLLRESGWGTDHLSGWADCWPGCGAWDGVAAWLVFGPPVAAVVAVVAAGVVAVIGRLLSHHRA